MKILKLFFIAPLLLPAPQVFSEETWDAWDEEQQEKTNSFPFTGYIENTNSYRTQDNPVLDEDWVANEIRARLEYATTIKDFKISLKGDGYYDGVLDEFESENRETLISFTPHSAVDISMGRQVLTWGTGDLVFLNDFFPKNWVAFFSGYDMQYLKAPSDAVKISTYTDAINMDVVWSPEFDPDYYIRGEKLSFYSPMADAIVAAPPAFSGEEPEHDLNNGELALRFYKTRNGVEYAAYAYRGFYKTPMGFDNVNTVYYFPELSSVGASIRGTAFNGIANAEIAHWNSRESDSGNNAFVPLSQSRLLLAFERELVRNLTTSYQYYVEYLHDYDTLVNPLVDEYRQILTTRWTYLAQQNRWQYSAFLFYSPSDKDYDLIANVLYRFSDQWQFNMGANVMGGEENYSQFGQMEENSNVYARAKFIF